MEYYSILIILTFILSDSILFAVNSSAVKDTVKEPKFCQWGQTFVDRSQACISKCSQSKGFIHPIHRKLICTDEYYVRRGIPKFGVPNDGRIYDCECQHPFTTVFSCGQKLHQEKITYEHCNVICQNYVTLTFIESNKTEVYCEIASEVKLFDLEAVTVSGLKQKGDSDQFYQKPICKCGLDIDVNFEKKLIQMENRRIKGKQTSEPLAKLCLTGRSQLTSRLSCVNKCNTANAFVDSKNDLICYHERKSATMISFELEDCQCGTILNRYRKNSEKVIPCYPERTYPSYGVTECLALCQSLYVYIFNSEPSRSLSYCDPREEPLDDIKGLKFQLGEREKYISARSNKEHFEYTCTCGLGPPLQSKNKNSSSSEVPINRRNIPNPNEIRSSYQISTNERNIRNSGFISSFDANSSSTAGTNQNLSVRNLISASSDRGGQYYFPPQTFSRGMENGGLRLSTSPELTTVPWITYSHSEMQPVSNDDSRLEGCPVNRFDERTITSVSLPSTNEPNIYFTPNAVSSSRALFGIYSQRNPGEKRNLVEFEFVQPGDYDTPFAICPPLTICRHEKGPIAESSSKKTKFLLPDLNIPDTSDFIPDSNIPSQNSTD